MSEPGEIPIGLDGAAMLALSLVIMTLSGGLTLAAAFVLVWRTARDATTDPVEPPTHALILGQALGPSGRPSLTFRARLERGRRLAARWPGLRLIVLGGRPAAGGISEAEAGQRHLIAAGVEPALIVLEDRSRHTLENLVHYRARPDGNRRGTPGQSPPLLITSRFHLARAGLLARGLGIAHRPCAAEDAWTPRCSLAAPMLKEALLIQWYVTGREFARLTRNRRMAARIS